VEKERAKEANGTKTARRLRPTIAAAEVSTTTMEAFMRTTLMRTINNSRFSIAFALPEFAFGRNLKGEAKQVFDELKHLLKRLEELHTERAVLEACTMIGDKVYALLCSDLLDKGSILTDFFHVIRLRLLSRNDVIIWRMAILVDYLIKNASSHKNAHFIFMLVSRQRLLKTFSYCSRDDRLQEHVCSFILDCIQAWGEAFSRPVERRRLYPAFHSTLRKLKEKGVLFRRADFDPR